MSLIPSMIFHVTAAFVILRHNAIEIGKAGLLDVLSPRSLGRKWREDHRGL